MHLVDWLYNYCIREPQHQPSLLCANQVWQMVLYHYALLIHVFFCCTELMSSTSPCPYFCNKSSGKSSIGIKNESTLDFGLGLSGGRCSSYALLRAAKVFWKSGNPCLDFWTGCFVTVTNGNTAILHPL